MKICLVTLDFIPYRSSGLSIYGEKLANGLSAEHNVTVLTSKTEETKKEEFIGNIHVIRVPIPHYDKTKWISFGYKASKILEKLNKRENFDIVHFIDVHVGYAYSEPFVATLHQSFDQRLRGDGGIPYHSSISNLIHRYIYYRIAKILEKKALNKSIKLISVSKATKEEFVKNYNLTSPKIDVIYNGIDTNFFKWINPEKLKEKLGLNNEKILLYVGFSTPRKGVEYLAEALNMLSDKNVKLLMIGRWEKGYRQKFYKHLGENRNRVIEIGYVSDNEMPQYYSLADIFVLPSLLEGFGFPLVEAMACEIPVISTNVGSIPEVVGDYGIIVPPRNAKMLANAIDKLLKDANLMEKLKIKRRTWVNEHFNEKRMVENTIKFYKDCVLYRQCR